VNPRVPNSQALEGLPRRQEADLIAAAARIFRTGFPNPERSGCPSQAALQSAAKRGSSAENEGVLEHLTSCSPCFMQYEQFLQKERVSKNLRLLALCASVLITIGLGAWFFASSGTPTNRPPEPKIVQKETPPAQPPPVQYEIAVVDLRNRSSVRGEQPSTSDEVVATLPTRPLDLSVYLPIGSDAGQYEIRIAREAQSPLVNARGSATLENRIMVMRTRADLTGLSPGRYLLGVRKGEFRWMSYTVILLK